MTERIDSLLIARPGSIAGAATAASGPSARKKTTITGEALLPNDNSTVLIVPDERVLSSIQVQQKTGLSRTTIWRLEQSNQFPARRTIALRRVGWLASEIDRWIALRQVGKRSANEEVPNWLRTR